MSFKIIQDGGTMTIITTVYYGRNVCYYRVENSTLNLGGQSY